MQTYHFETKISASGVIEIPNTPDLFNKVVEIIIITKSKNEPDRMSGKQFIKKWAGALKNIDADKEKENYLSKKYK